MSYQPDYVAQEPDRAEVDAWPGLLLLEFGAPWCPHCIAAQPFLQAWLADRDDVGHIKVEDGRGQALGRSFRVKLWPTLLLLRSGRELARVVRPVSQSDLMPLTGALSPT